MLLFAVCFLCAVVGILFSRIRFGFPLYVRVLLLFGSQLVFSSIGWVLLLSTSGTTVESLLLGQVALWSTIGVLVLVIFDHFLSRSTAPSSTVSQKYLNIFSYVLAICLVIVSAAAVPVIVQSSLLAGEAIPSLPHPSPSSSSLALQTNTSLSSPLSSPTPSFDALLSPLYSTLFFFPASAWIECLFLLMCLILAAAELFPAILGRRSNV